MSIVLLHRHWAGGGVDLALNPRHCLIGFSYREDERIAGVFVYIACLQLLVWLDKPEPTMLPEGGAA